MKPKVEVKHTETKRVEMALTLQEVEEIIKAFLVKNYPQFRNMPISIEPCLNMIEERLEGITVIAERKKES